MTPRFKLRTEGTQVWVDFPYEVPNLVRVEIMGGLDLDRYRFQPLNETTLAMIRAEIRDHLIRLEADGILFWDAGMKPVELAAAHIRFTYGSAEQTPHRRQERQLGHKEFRKPMTARSTVTTLPRLTSRVRISSPAPNKTPT